MHSNYEHTHIKIKNINLLQRPRNVHEVNQNGVRDPQEIVIFDKHKYSTSMSGERRRANALNLPIQASQRSDVLLSTNELLPNS